MDIEQARLLAQPNPNGGAPAKIFSRSEAAEMSRAADALGASDDPADRVLADAAEAAVVAWMDAGEPLSAVEAAQSVADWGGGTFTPGLPAAGEFAADEPNVVIR